MNTKTNPEYDLDRMIMLGAKFMGTDSTKLITQSKKRKLSFARNLIIFYLSNKQVNGVHIAAALQRHNSTILQQRERIREKLEEDPSKKLKYEKLTEFIDQNYNKN